ncbi:MAG: hypothetical protein QOD09_3370 [Bradyrhizobium sp.]|jgi:hypothetical protein|nr:hypothetical protein [Bradyrhizobium sp.]MEA2953626.1 hypothetical protein [Alphaproteobacteria bacterium]
MTAETIDVFIDTHQLAAQRNNNYSLYLAKQVNGKFTVIWQSKGPVPTINNPAYEYKNVFRIQVPSYKVNYGTVTTTSGSVTFNASGLAENITIGQTVQLDENGLFGDPTNNGTPGEITINNQLQGNPHAILLDDKGNPIFVTQSGMDTGAANLTPIDTYQIWFDNYQETGTIIAHNVSKVATVVFDDGTTDKTISYSDKGEWQSGPLPQKLNLAAAGLEQEADPHSVTVLATFTYGLTAAAATYLLSKLIDKFGNLRPISISASVGGIRLTATFAGPRTREILAAHGLDTYEAAVNSALRSAKQDPASDLQRETWTMSETTVTASY